MYSLEDLHSVLLCRVVESDYLSGDQRMSVMHRLDEYFKESPKVPTSVVEKRKASYETELWLAISSAVAAMVASSVFALFLDRGRLIETVTNSQSKTLLEFAVLTMGMILLTAAGLALFTRLRESTRSTDEREILRARDGFVFERDFISAARGVNPSIETQQHRWPDLAFKEGGGKVAVEIKGGLDSMSTSRLRALIAETERRRDADGYTCVLIVSPTPPGSRARGIETDSVKIALPVQALDRIRAAA